MLKSWTDNTVVLGLVWDSATALTGTMFPGPQSRVGDGPRSVTVDDLDGNGDTDLAAARRLTNNVTILLNLVVVPGDFDADGDVDLDDYAHLDECMSGPDSGPYVAGCQPFDFEPDLDVDLTDFGAFQEAFAGL